MLRSLILLAATALGAQESTRLLERANKLYQAQRPEQAIPLYESYLNSYPDRADVRVFLGAAFLGAGRVEEAMEQARRAIELDGRSAKAYILAGRIHTSGHDWYFARKAYETALRLNPNDAEAWYFAGRGYYEENAFPDAIDAFRRAIELGATRSRSYENLALSYEGLERYAEAEAAYRRAVELSGGEYRPHFAYGVFLYKQGRIQAALEALERAFQMNPNAVEARFELGKALYHSGRLSEAARVVQGGLDLSRECRLYHLLARIHSLGGNEAAAEGARKGLETCEADLRSLTVAAR